MKTRYTTILNLTILATALIISGCLSDGGSSEPGSAAPDPDVGTNSPPIISGSPASAVKVGENYSFTPSASDPDGDPCTFSIENRPSWADFDAATGSISGTPTLGDIGIYSNIRISVSDGIDNSSLPDFAVEVTQVAAASTTLSWTAPNLNEDGTTLTDLAGYKIYYGKSSRNYTSEIQIDNPSVTTYFIENLSPDTYYFAASALNS